MRQYFRAMKPSDDGLPIVGVGKRFLGVLATETASADGSFGPGTGGMSVSPDSPWHVPHHRRPRGMGRGSTGPAGDWVFRIDQDAVELAGLTVRIDPESPVRHGFVEPKNLMLLPTYLASLAATRGDWRRAWPWDLA